MGTFVVIVLSFLDNSPTTEVAVGEFSLVVNLGPFVASGVFLCFFCCQRSKGNAYHMRGSEQSQVRIQQPLSRHLFLCQSTRQWQAIINTRFSAKSRSPHLFTLRKKRHSSSSWAGKSPNFRREIRQSHYRNDPVKYDLNSSPPILPL